MSAVLRAETTELLGHWEEFFVAMITDDHLMKCMAKKEFNGGFYTFVSPADLSFFRPVKKAGLQLSNKTSL